MREENQGDLIRALQSPAVYPHDSDRLQLIETHISWVFLCGPYAYKIKKAINLGFLDFSTLEKRKFYCEEELRLNSRLAPDIYLGVVAITGTPKQPQLEISGEALEYAVKMRRFPQEALLSNMLKQSLLTSRHIDQLIAQIASFHQRVPAAPSGAEYGDPAHVAAPVNENFNQIRKCILNPQHLQVLDSINEWANQEHQAHRKELINRKQLGFIRECHGDMHLGNIAIVNGRPVIFDGIEFNPELYWIDVMSEAAFLCMDLEDGNRRDFAFRFLNGYLELTGDYEGLRVFRYYLAYRAMVRAKVAAIRFNQLSRSDLRFPEAQEFERYLRLALIYTRPQRPALLITHGLSGSGKSTLSAPLAVEMGAIRIRSDRERQRLFGRGKGKGDGKAVVIEQGAYSDAANRQVYDKLAELAGYVLASGYSAIIDATFLRRHQRDLFMQLAKSLGVPFQILFFRADADVLRQRIRRRAREGQDISEADICVLEHQLSGYTGLDAGEQAYTVDIDTESACEPEPIVALVPKIASTVLREIWSRAR